MVFYDPLPNRARARVFRIRPNRWCVYAHWLFGHRLYFTTWGAAMDYALRAVRSRRMEPATPWNPPPQWPSYPSAPVRPTYPKVVWR